MLHISRIIITSYFKNYNNILNSFKSFRFQTTKVSLNWDRSKIFSITSVYPNTTEAMLHREMLQALLFQHHCWELRH